MSKKLTIVIVLLGLLLAGFWFLSSSEPSEPIEVEVDSNSPDTEVENNTANNDNEEEINSPLTGSWEWQETVMSDGEVIEPDEAESFTVNFTQDGTINGTTDCNSFSGSYSIDGNNLSVGPLASTKMFCPDSQETEFTSMLISDNTFMIDDESGQLVIMLPIDSGSVILNRVED